MKKYIIDEETLKSLLRDSKMLECLEEYHCINYEAVNYDDMMEERSKYIENDDLSQFESIHVVDNKEKWSDISVRSNWSSIVDCK